MKLFIDEMPALSGECPFFSRCDGICNLTGDLCGLREREQGINDAKCQSLKEFKPFVSEPEFKAIFSTRELLSKSDISYPGLLRRFNILADILDLERGTDPHKILDKAIKELLEDEQ